MALQFADGDLADSTKVFRYLRDSFKDKKFYVLGDTSYSECCIDDVNASHAKANDMIIKFGDSCLSTASDSKQSEGKKFIYVMKQPTIGDQEIEAIITASEQWMQEEGIGDDSETWIYCDTPYYFALRQKLKERCNFGDIDTAKFTMVPSHEPEGQVNFLNRLFKKSDKQKHFLYIGSHDEDAEFSKLTSYILPNVPLVGSDVPGTPSFASVSYLDPAEGTVTNCKKMHSKLVMGRYANLERVKDAEIVGILIGTVVCDNHMVIIRELKRQILAAGKKYYEVLIGKINEPKLKNFQFIDLYVIVACPWMSLVNFRKWNMHVVTPHEALMALDDEHYPWQGRIVTDFNSLSLTKLEAAAEEELDAQILQHEHATDETALVAVSK